MTPHRTTEPNGRRPNRGAGSILRRALFAGRGPVPVRLLGRALLLAALVGVAAGLVGSLFFLGVELVQSHVLEQGCGYVPLRAAGEPVASRVEGGPVSSLARFG